MCKPFLQFHAKWLNSPGPLARIRLSRPVNVGVGYT
jgi:hypothetical protein